MPVPEADSKAISAVQQRGSPHRSGSNSTQTSNSVGLASKGCVSRNLNAAVISKALPAKATGAAVTLNMRRRLSDVTECHLAERCQETTAALREQLRFVAEITASAPDRCRGAAPAGPLRPARVATPHEPGCHRGPARSKRRPSSPSLTPGQIPTPVRCSRKIGHHRNGHAHAGSRTSSRRAAVDRDSHAATARPAIDKGSPAGHGSSRDSLRSLTRRDDTTTCRKVPQVAGSEPLSGTLSASETADGQPQGHRAFAAHNS